MLYVCRVAHSFQFLQYIVKLHWSIGAAHQYQLNYIRTHGLRFHLYLNIYLQKYITFA